jgi:ppGpp synthetase/RelA/SpoT-type nucleotidyltranferase
LTLFEGAVDIDDRREKPSHGYRAVHVIPRVDAHSIEIQVRTPLQDIWAQTNRLPNLGMP